MNAFADLHTHTLLSDGCLVPAEQIRRAEVTGYSILGIADHADLATMKDVIPVLLEAARRENALGRMKVLAGVEATHVRPEHIAEFVQTARQMGAHFVIVHGETIAEPVIAGTNRAAIEAGCDILAHPGLISADDARLAAAKGVLLEISGKAGHCLGNGHVAATAARHGAGLIFGSDAHTPDQFYPAGKARSVCLGAALSASQVDEMFASAARKALEWLGRS